jgi:hypothetical protein
VNREPQLTKQQIWTSERIEMGANFFFDDMLPGVDHENAVGAKDLKRQVEVFAHGSALYLRVGPFGSQNSGENTYTVQLSKEKGHELRDALHRAMQYLAWER